VRVNRYAGHWTAAEWAVLAAQQARIAAHREAQLGKWKRAHLQVARIAAARPLDHVAHDTPDRELREVAARRAALVGVEFGAWDRGNPRSELCRLNERLQALQARPFAFKGKVAEVDQLRGFLRRVDSPDWWRRQLRRAVVREAETLAIQAGQVNAGAGQWYCTDATVKRRQAQHQRNAAMLQAVEVENEEGAVFTLKALADKSTGNKAIRRGELMTRVKGCEEWADANGHPGVFLTLTTPSRFHQHLSRGRRMNPAYRGATPRDAQDWLCATWAKARAALARAGVEAYGLRVAEPHNDGTPHWHALLWVKDRAQRDRLVSTLRRYWLADAGDEPGAQRHRLTCVDMRSGGATGYVAKYIAKNIDDAGAVATEGHHDELQGEAFTLKASGQHRTGQRDLFDNPAARVEAWAAAWGIRQFQSIGQPPVTVWRELRRVPAEIAADACVSISTARDAAHRHADDVPADWRLYMAVQGGPCIGADYRVRVARRVEEFAGRYETREVARPIGVYVPGESDEPVPSTRRTWKPRGTWTEREREGARRAAAWSPWTRFNNCTRPPRRPRMLQGLGIALAMPLEGIAGGLRNWKAPPCPVIPPSLLPN
jgi:hypothetical protein